MFRWCSGLVLGWLVLGSHAAWAQQATVRIQEGPHYVGEPILVRVSAEGFEEEPQPICQPGSLGGGVSLSLVSVRPSVSSYTQIINGRVTSHRSVVFAFDYHLTVQQPGDCSLEPFVVRQGKTTAQTRSVKVKVNEIKTDPDMRVALVLPDEAVYPGQRVDVEIQWWYAGDLGDVRNLVIRSELFDRFSFIDEKVAPDDTALPIVTADGTVPIRARIERRTLNGRTFVVLIGRRQLVVDNRQSVDLAPITASVEKVTRWGRSSFFGGRQPLASSRLRSVGKPQTLHVKPLPLSDAPASFAGAVGRGFTVSVEADRTVVQTGDPIVLTVTLQGDGNLEQAGPPRLGHEAVLDAQQFRAAAGDVAGTVNGNRKQFSMTVRVLDERASEIPPIAYSWFDSASERFETVYSEPIALRVLAAQVVGAEDVISGVSAPAQPGARPQLQESNPPSPEATAVDPGGAFDLSGADLAITTDIDRLSKRESERFGGYPLFVGVHLGSLGLVCVGWWWRRVAEADPRVRNERKALKHQLQQIHQARRLPRQQAAGQIAEALRRLAPLASAQHRDRIDQLLAACDAVAFAPRADGDGVLDEALCRQALETADAMLGEVG